ncbi:unnamed protein product, partial [Brenthis ino]
MMREQTDMTDGFMCSSRHGGESHPTSQLWAVTETFLTERSITKLGTTRDSNLAQPDVVHASHYTTEAMSKYLKKEIQHQSKLEIDLKDKDQSVFVNI